MSTIASAFSHSIGKKLIMALSGLFLVSFLLVHVSGNTLLFKGDGGVAFNEYTKFMTTNPLTKVLEWVLFAGFLIHIAYGIWISSLNNKARPVKYAYKGGRNSRSSWFSRNMITSGSIVLAFLVIHLVMFWGQYHFGEGESVSLDEAYHQSWKVTQPVFTASNQPAVNELGESIVAPDSYISKDQYELLKSMGVSDVQGISMTKVVEFSFSQPLIVIFYVLAMILLAFHLIHGFQSGFRTMGLIHKKYTPIIKAVGFIVAIVIPITFALMPIWFYVQTLI